MSDLGSFGGLSFSIWDIIGSLLFGTIGFVAFMYGRKRQAWRTLAIGIVLMVYPYIIPGSLALWGIGVGLTAVLIFWRE